MKRLLDAADGLVRLVTLAPERDPDMKVIRYLADRKILVSAGHCDPSLDQLRAAIDAGLSVFTHLGNGCPAMLPRHDNVVQRVLSLRDRLTICFIADGVHIPPVALGNYLRLTGTRAADRRHRRHVGGGLRTGALPVGSQTVDICDDMVARATDGSHLMGSTATMPQMAALLQEQVGLAEDEVRRLLGDNPRRLAGVQVLGLRARAFYVCICSIMPWRWARIRAVDT